MESYVLSRHYDALEH